MEISTLSDAELNQQLNAVLNEQERRAALATTATQVEQLTVRYIGIGGDPAALTDAVTRAKDSVQPTAPQDSAPTAGDVPA
jgi:hypothetical protein